MSLTKATYEAKRAPLLETYQKILKEFDDAGDFPDPDLHQRCQDARNAVLELDDQWAREQRANPPKPPVKMYHCVVHHVEYPLYEGCPKCKARDPYVSSLKCPKCR